MAAGNVVYRNVNKIQFLAEIKGVNLLKANEFEL